MNINPNYNEDLKKACKTLNDYSLYTARVRLYAKTMKLEDAVNQVINECIREGILAEFLSRNKAKAMKMAMIMVMMLDWQPDMNPATRTDWQPAS